MRTEEIVEGSYKKWGNIKGGYGHNFDNVKGGYAYNFDNYPYFLITFLAALPPCRHCFHRTAKLSCCLIVWCYIVMVQNWMVPNFPGTICGLRGKFSVHFFHTTHIWYIFAFDTNLQYFAFSYILIIAACICINFHMILKFTMFV